MRPGLTPSEERREALVIAVSVGVLIGGLAVVYFWWFL